METETHERPTRTGTDPLMNARHEAMVQVRVADRRSRTESYRLTAHMYGTGDVPSDRTCQNQASIIFRRPEVKARENYLMAERDASEEPELPPSVLVQAPLFDMSQDIVDDDYVMRYLSAALRQAAATGAVDASTLKAAGELVKRLEEHRKDQELATLDLTHLAKHLTQWAAWPGPRIIEEIGGLRFLLDRMMDLLGVSPADVIACLSTDTPST